MIVSNKIAGMFKHCGFVNIDYLVTQKIYVSPSVILNILQREWRKWKKPLCMWLLNDGGDPYDPTFGYETAGATSQEVAKDMRGSWFTCPEDGTANSLTVYIRQDTSGGSVNVKTAIYDKSDDSLVRSSEEIAITSTDYYWQTFNLLTPNPDLTANKDYWLVVWGDVGNGLEYPYIKYDSETSKGADESATDYTDGEGDNLWENPWTGYSIVDKIYSIYCTYTTAAAGQPYISRVQQITGMQTYNPIH